MYRKTFKRIQDFKVNASCVLIMVREYKGLLNIKHGIALSIFDIRKILSSSFMTRREMLPWKYYCAA